MLNQELEEGQGPVLQQEFRRLYPLTLDMFNQKLEQAQGPVQSLLDPMLMSDESA